MAVYRFPGGRLKRLWSDGRRIVLLSRIDGAEVLGAVGGIWVRMARRDMAIEIGLLVLASRLLVGHIV